MSTADAVTRELAWLTAVDDLPSLLTDDGGPWDVVDWWQGARFARDKHGLYVDARDTGSVRTSSQRIMPQYQFVLTLYWPILAQGPGGAGTSSKALIAETEQANLDAAKDLVLQRINGFPGDKTHGGRFLSVAENPRKVTYTKADPVEGVQQRELRSLFTYRADDYEVNG